MKEASKSKSLFSDIEQQAINGKGIDIGCGDDPISPSAIPFDRQHGDANYITKFIQGPFDYVYASHCLEHMHDPERTLSEWWTLVRPGGFLFFTVPDEDLYEQGVFPSRFNPDHKATFTISKSKSWSPRSYNVMFLAQSLVGSEILLLQLQDEGYDRSKLRHGSCAKYFRYTRIALRIVYYYVLCKIGLRSTRLAGWIDNGPAFDQTLTGARSQIACVIRKKMND